jgi:hypothetical protein
VCTGSELCGCFFFGIPPFFTIRAILRIGLVLRYLALGRGCTLRVDTTLSSQLQRHSGWSLALGHRLGLGPIVLAIVPEYSLVRGQVLPNIPVIQFWEY